MALKKNDSMAANLETFVTTSFWLLVAMASNLIAD